MKIKNVKNNIKSKINNRSMRASTPIVNYKKIGVVVGALADPLNKISKQNNVGAAWHAAHGITLIALIITIIIMLILAGIVVSLTIGENGIFNISKYAVTKTEEEKAREKLELALADLQAKKYTDIENYNEKGYIDNYLTNEKMLVAGDVVTVDGWNFTIDRTVPQIVEDKDIDKEEVKKVTITTPYIGTTSFTTKISKVENEEEVEGYTYIIDNEEITSVEKEYTTPKEHELEPESTHTVKVIAKYKNGTQEDSNILTIKTEPRTYLYNNGDECIDITGGWKAIAVGQGEGNPIKKPTLTYDSNLKCLNAQLYGDSNGGNTGGSITINNKIDYSGYNYINIIYTANLTMYNASNIVDLCKNHENEVSWADNIFATLCYSEPINVKKKYKNVKKKINDVNSLYIYLQSYYGTTASLNLYEVWLEK